MSGFLGNIGHITEWVVVSNLENRAVNAACDKAQGWWNDRKKNKHDTNSASAAPISSTPSQYQQTNYPPPSSQYPSQQQASYMSPPPPPPPSTSARGQLLVTVNQVDGLHQWGPLMVIIECNYQRYQITFKQFQQQFTFPINQFDYDQVFIWVQAEHQQQTIAHGEIPIRILLNNNNNWNSQQQQRWIPLRDQYNNPAGQLLVSAEYRTNYSSAQQMPGPPPPYAYYS